MRFRDTLRSHIKMRHYADIAGRHDTMPTADTQPPAAIFFIANRHLLSRSFEYRRYL